MNSDYMRIKTLTILQNVCCSKKLNSGKNNLTYFDTQFPFTGLLTLIIHNQ